MDGGLGLDLGRESEEFRAGTVAAAAALHFRRRETHRRAQLLAYGPQLAQPNAPEEREGAGDHSQVEKTAGGEGRPEQCHRWPGTIAGGVEVTVARG